MMRTGGRDLSMAGEVYYGCKRFFAKVGILAIMLAVVAFFAYAYILPSVSPEIITNPKRLVEAPERQRVYEITDEFINTYAYVELKSELCLIGSEEWLRSTMATLQADKVSYTRLDPLQTEGLMTKSYNELTDMEIRLIRQYLRLYEIEVAPDAEDVGMGDCAIQWDHLFACYDAFKAADAEYQAQLAAKESGEQNSQANSSSDSPHDANAA